MTLEDSHSFCGVVFFLLMIYGRSYIDQISLKMELRREALKKKKLLHTGLFRPLIIKKTLMPQHWEGCTLCFGITPSDIYCLHMQERYVLCQLCKDRNQHKYSPSS